MRAYERPAGLTGGRADDRAATARCAPGQYEFPSDHDGRLQIRVDEGV